MTKNRIYGEDVLVRIMSNDGSVPYILDFDTIEINSLTNVRTYKAIGKRVSKHQSINTGYKITLTRAIRDNYLDALIGHNDYHIQKGLEPPLYMIDYTINHGYKIEDINYENELDDSFSQSAPKQKIEVQNPITSNLAKKIAGIAGTVANLNPVTANIKNQLVQGSKIIQTGANLIKAGVNLFNSINPAKIQNNATYLQAMRDNSPLTGDGFKQNWQYKNCSIGDFSSTSSPRTNSMQTIVIYATNRDNLNDNNFYDDQYMVEKMKLHHINNTNQIIDKRVKSIDNQAPEIINAVKNSFIKAFEEMYGDLL